jgi:hypothetical protein
MIDRAGRGAGAMVSKSPSIETAPVGRLSQAPTL